MFGLSVNGIVSLNKQNNTFTHLAYINPNNFKIPMLLPSTVKLLTETNQMVTYHL